MTQRLLKTRSYAEWLKTVSSEGTSRSVSKWPIARFRFSADSIEYEGWQRETVKKGIPELKSPGLIAKTASGGPTLTDKGHKTSVDSEHNQVAHYRYLVEIALTGSEC